MRLLTIIIFLLIAGSTAVGQDIDSLQKQFVYHFKRLDSAAKKSKVDTIYCCRGSANFMENYTNIETGTMGNILGRWGFTKEALRQWHEWYDKKYKVKNN